MDRNLEEEIIDIPDSLSSKKQKKVDNPVLQNEEKDLEKEDEKGISHLSLLTITSILSISLKAIIQ